MIAIATMHPAGHRAAPARPRSRPCRRIAAAAHVEAAQPVQALRRTAGARRRFADACGPAASAPCSAKTAPARARWSSASWAPTGPTPASVRVGDSEVELKNPRQAHALGIGMVYQHFTLVENMTVVENMVMAREHVPAVINWKEETESSRAFMDTMPFRVDPRPCVRNLAAGEKQKVEMLKQLYLQRKVLILDEPTSVLTPDEADEVLGMVRGMCKRGQAQRADDHAQVPRSDGLLRRGDGAAARQVHGRRPGQDLTPRTMAEMMMGTATLPEQAARDNGAGNGRGKPRLVIDELDRRRRNRRRRLCAACRWTCGRTRSSASPASPATASASWSRSWPGSGRRRGGQIMVHGERLRRDARGDPQASISTSCRRCRCKTPASAP